MTEMERRVYHAFTDGQREHEREGDGQRPLPEEDGGQESERRDGEAAYRRRGVVRGEGEILCVILSGVPRGTRSMPGMGPG